MPCAVERAVRSGRGSIRASARARPPTKIRIISNNSYAHDDQGDNLGQENRGLDGVLYKLRPFVSDIAISVLKRDVKLQLTNSVSHPFGVHKRQDSRGNTRMSPALAPTAAAASSAVLGDGDETTVELRVIQLLNGVLHVRRRRKLHHAATDRHHNIAVTRSPEHWHKGSKLSLSSTRLCLRWQHWSRTTNGCISHDWLLRRHRRQPIKHSLCCSWKTLPVNQPHPGWQQKLR